jgi:hypothetical protein
MTTANDIQKTAIEISRLGSGIVRSAHLMKFGANGTSVGEMATNLAGAVSRGDITLGADQSRYTHVSTNTNANQRVI